jgi:hypothetical protein
MDWFVRGDHEMKLTFDCCCRPFLFSPIFLLHHHQVYGIVGATLFSFYMAYHSRYIVGGTSAHHVMNEKDYVFGAMTLYNDVINVFIYLLKAIGEDKEKH